MAIHPKIKALISTITRSRSGIISAILAISSLAVIVPVLAVSLKPDGYKQGSSPQTIVAHKIPDKVTVSVTSASSEQAKPTTTPTTTAPTTVKPTTAPAPVVVPSPSSSVSNLTPAAPATTGSATTAPSTNNNTSVQNYDSENWAGYMATTASYTTVSASWTATTPIASGHSLSADATWIGIGGVTTGDLIQVGTENTIEPGGQVETAAFYEMLPAASISISQITVSPGDSISASVVQITPGQWTISITDLTDNQTYSTTVAYTSTNSSAEWIEEDPSLTSSRLITLDDFGVANFTNAQTLANGSSLGLGQANPDSITLVNREGESEAVPSSLSGNNFSVSWQSP